MRVVSFGKKHARQISIAVLALLTITAAFNMHAIKGQLDDWKLLPQPERLTELYYADHAKLPTTYTPGTEQKFSFITHNLEYQDTQYEYTVTQKSEDGTTTQPITKGTFKLRPDNIGTTPVTITPTDLGKRSQIEVQLTNTTTKQQQSIHYWVTSTNVTSTAPTTSTNTEETGA